MIFFHQRHAKSVLLLVRTESYSDICIEQKLESMLLEEKINELARLVFIVFASIWAKK
jgi:hypothetical protein